MPLPGPEVFALGELYRLAVAYSPRRGAAGERLGAGTGASLEFQDRRAYAPGDDVRHLDWRAFARTDQLLVRQYREEILPHVEILIDGSRSMAVDKAKAALTVELAAVLASAARADGFRVSLFVLGDRPDRLESSVFMRHGVDFTGERGLQGVLRETLGLLRPGSLRMVVSDFLSPHIAAELVRGLARGAGGLALLQVLTTDDTDPPTDVALRLRDAESGEDLDLVLERPLRKRYLDRLRRLIAGLQEECLRHGAMHLQLGTDVGLRAHCRGLLTHQGLLAPA